MHELSNEGSAMSEMSRFSRSTYNLLKNVGWAYVSKVVKLVHISGLCLLSTSVPVQWDPGWFTYLYFSAHISRIL